MVGATNVTYSTSTLIADKTCRARLHDSKQQAEPPTVTAVASPLKSRHDRTPLRAPTILSGPHTTESHDVLNPFHGKPRPRFALPVPQRHVGDRLQSIELAIQAGRLWDGVCFFLANERRNLRLGAHAGSGRAGTKHLAHLCCCFHNLPRPHLRRPCGRGGVQGPRRPTDRDSEIEQDGCTRFGYAFTIALYSLVCILLLDVFYWP
jgi:hypothetical protein